MSTTRGLRRAALVGVATAVAVFGLGAPARADDVVPAPTAVLPTPASVSLVRVDAVTYLTWTWPQDYSGFTVTGWQIHERGSGEPPVEVPLATTYLTMPDAVAGDVYEVSVITTAGVGEPAANAAVIPDTSWDSVGAGYLEPTDGSRTPGLWINSTEPGAVRLPLADDGHEYTTPAAGPRGLAIVVGRADTAGLGEDDWDLWESGLRPGPGLLRLTQLPGQETDPQFSPDGATIAFTYRRTPSSPPEVWTVPAIPDAGPPALPTSTRRFVGASHPSWLSATDLVAADERSAGAPLLHLRLGSDAATVVGSYPGTAGARQPTVAWDGRTAACVTAAGAPMRLDLASGASAPEDLQPAASSGVRFGEPNFTVDGNVAWSQSAPGEDVSARFSRGSTTLGFAEYAAIPRPTTEPVVSIPAEPGVVRPGVAYPVRVEDPMLRSVVTTCQVDGRPAVACGAGIPTTGLADGSHQVSVTATSLRGSATVSATFRVDGTPPSVATVRGPALVRTAPATVSSTATDADQVVSFQGRERVRDLGRGFSSWHPIPLPGVRGTTVVRLAPGQTRCIAARAHDAAGNVGPWGPRTCVSRMVDDSALQHTSGWHERTVAGAADGTALRAKRQGEKLHSRTGVRRGRFLLVAQRCARCGQVEVRIGRAVVGKVDLRGRSGWHTFTLRSKRTGKLRVVTTSQRRVTIDGFYSLP